MGLIIEIYKVFVHLDLKRGFFFFSFFSVTLLESSSSCILCLVVLMQDVSHNLETWWRTVDEEKEKPAIVFEEWELCAFYQSWAGLRCWVPFLFFCFMFFFFLNRGPFTAPAALPPWSPSLINSGFVHLLCCMFESAAKERSVQVPRHVYILKHTILTGTIE